MTDYDRDPTTQQPHRTVDAIVADRSALDTPAPRPRVAHPATASLLHLQRTAGNAGVVQLLGGDEPAADSPVHDVVGKGGGSPLDGATRAAMEASFGQGFGDVRVHTDDKASRSAESVGANAYTVGSDVVFKAGQFDVSSTTGQRTLAHELTHVVQQRNGPVDGSAAPGGIRLSDPADRFEQAAAQTADAIVSSPVPAASGPTVAAPITAQRDVDDEEELAL